MKKLMCLGVFLTMLILGTGALAQNGGVELKNVRFVFSGQGDRIYAEVLNEHPFRMEHLEVRAFIEVPQGPAHQSSSQRFNLEPGEKHEVVLPLPHLPEATQLRLRVMQAMQTATEKTFGPKEFKRSGAQAGPKSLETPAGPAKGAVKSMEVPETVTPLNAPKTMNPQAPRNKRRLISKKGRPSLTGALCSSLCKQPTNPDTAVIP
jgi:hypothetical protein